MSVILSLSCFFFIASVAIDMIGVTRSDGVLLASLDLCDAGVLGCSSNIDGSLSGLLSLPVEN